MKRRLLTIPAAIAFACLAIAATPSTAPPGGGPGAAQEQQKAPAKPNKRGKLTGWVRGFTTTEYHPTPESWFGGPSRSFPGLAGRHRVAWLLSAHGIAMEGHEIGRAHV